ncbi:Exportin-5 [Podila clonocystis]|nr:Exportin-5 [Podila clonocystis]
MQSGKRHKRSAPLYGYFLAHKDNKHGDVVRHFGLGLIESAVRYRWTDGSMDEALKNQIRMHVISLASEGTLPILEEQMFIKEKVARLYVEVAKRQWPGEWDDMDLFLKQMYFNDAAAECYDVIASRVLSDAEKEKIIWPLVNKGGIDLVSKAYLTYAAQILQGDSYLFIQKLVQDPNVHSFVPPLLELYSGYLAKDFENRRQNDAVYRHFASIDFDSVSEFRARATQTFQKAVDVIHLGVPVVPLDAFLWVANKVAGALKVQVPVEIAKDSAMFQNFDGTLTLMEVSVSSLKDLINDKSHPQSSQVLGAMNTLLGMLLEYNVNCPIALDRVVGSLSAFTDMFKLNSTLLFQCLDKLFKTVEYPKTNGPENEIKELRRRAANTLVKIGRSIPNTLFPIYGEVESAVQRLIQQNLVWPGEKRPLLTFLLVIGFNAEMAHDKRAIFEKVVLPVLNDFQSATLQEALAGPKNFMTFIGAIELSTANSKSLQPSEIEQLQASIIQRRTQLSWSIETLLSFMKESTSGKDPLKLGLWSSCLGSMLPNLLSTIRCLNAMADPSLWQDLSPDMASLFTLTAEEKGMLVTGKYPASAPGPVTVTKMISDLKIWMAIVRDNAYKFLAQMTTLGPMFYSIPSLQVMLEQSLFEHMGLLSNRQIRFLISSAVQPLVLNTPPEFMESVLSHLLSALLPYFDQRLIKDWQLAADEGLVMDENEEQEELDVSDEIVREILLRDLTRSMADFAVAILDFGKQKGGPSTAAVQGSSLIPAGKEITTLAVFLLSNDRISRSIMELLCHILTFKDTRSCMKATEAALCVLAALVQNYPSTSSIIAPFSSMILRACLEALNDPYHQEGQDKLILLITEVYVEVRAFDQAPKVAFQQVPGIDISQLDAFEAQLSAFTNKSKKNAIVRNFLQGIIGVAKSEWFKQREQGNKPTSSRTITGTYEKPSQSILDSAQDEDIGEGLANLFDE